MAVLNCLGRNTQAVGASARGVATTRDKQEGAPSLILSTHRFSPKRGIKFSAQLAEDKGMRLPLIAPKPKRVLPPILCVPSSYCLTCPIDQREAVCFFKRTKQDEPATTA